MNEWYMPMNESVYQKQKQKKNKNQNKAVYLAWVQASEIFFPKWPYLTGPSKGNEKETSLRDSI